MFRYRKLLQNQPVRDGAPEHTTQIETRGRLVCNDEYKYTFAYTTDAPSHTHQHSD